MSSDPHLDAIVEIMTDNGYTPLVRTQPTIRDADISNLPLVEINPVERRDGYWISAGHYSETQRYQITYIVGNQLLTAVPDVIHTFKQTMISVLSGLPDLLAAVPQTYMVRIKDDKDYRRELLTKQYTFSWLFVDVSWISI